MSDILKTLTAQVSSRLVHDLELLLTTEIEKRGVLITRDNAHKFAGRGRRCFFPDKTTVYLWDNKPILKLWHEETEMISGHITFKQNYQLFKIHPS